jgi:hypothetical protein
MGPDLPTDPRPERQRRAGAYSHRNLPRCPVFSCDLDAVERRLGPGSAALRALSGIAVWGRRGAGREAAGWLEISQRIPGRSVSGEPGPTLTATCRDAPKSRVILTWLRPEWVPDRRPCGLVRDCGWGDGDRLDAAGWLEISQRIPGRSVSGEPGPTLITTCRDALSSRVILTPLRGEWVPDRRPCGPCPGLRFGGGWRSAGCRRMARDLSADPRPERQWRAGAYSLGDLPRCPCSLVILTPLRCE